MNELGQHNHPLGYLWKIPVVAVVYTVAKNIGWTLVTKAGMPFPETPAGHTYSHVLGFLSALVLSACLVLLARELGGSRARRWFVLLAFTYVSFVINNQIEGVAFTTSTAVPTMLLFFVLPCVLATGVAVVLVRPDDSEDSLATVFSDRPLSRWWWRPVVAWLAFPLIYYFFGALIYPLVADVYAQQDSGLQVPSQIVVLGAVTTRSLLFLAVTIPVIGAWRGSRVSLILSLAAALTAMVGVAGLIESSWMPTRLRLVHSIEIIADSLVHAWVLVALLVPRAPKAEDVDQETAVVV